MSNQSFFKTFKKNLHTLEHQLANFASIDDIEQLRQMSLQLQTYLAEYKKRINKSFDLLWEKRNVYNELLAANINAGALTSEQYQVTEKKLRQLDCDIQALTQLLKEENPAITIEQYELRLEVINQRIRLLQPQPGNC